MDLELYQEIVKSSYDRGRAFSQLSKAEIAIRKLLENFEEEDEIGIVLEEVHEILGNVLDKLEY